MIYFVHADIVEFCMVDTSIYNTTIKDAVYAYIFEKYNLDPLVKYKILFEKIPHKNDIYGVYFSEIEKLNNSLKNSSLTKKDRVIYLPQLFRVLFENLTISEHIAIFISNLEQIMTISLYIDGYLGGVYRVDTPLEADDIIKQSSPNVIYACDIPVDFTTTLKELSPSMQILEFENFQDFLTKASSSNHLLEFSPLYKIPIYKRKSGRIILINLSFIILYCSFTVANYLHKNKTLNHNLSTQSQLLEESRSISSKLESINSNINILNTQLQEELKITEQIINSINNLSSIVNTQQGATKFLVDIAKSAKKDQIIFEELCFESDMAKIKFSSQESKAISNYSKSLAKYGFDIGDFQLQKTNSDRYVGIIDVSR